MLYDEVGGEVALVQPGAEHAAVLEVDGRHHGDEVAHRSIRVHGQVGGAEGSAQADAVEGDLGRAGGFQRPFNGPGDDLVHPFLEAELAVLFADHAPVQQEHVVPVVDQVLDHAVAGKQVQDVGPADAQPGHNQVGQAQGLPFPGAVAEQAGVAALPDDFVRRHLGGWVGRVDDKSVEHGLEALPLQLRFLLELGGVFGRVDHVCVSCRLLTRTQFVIARSVATWRSR